LEDALTSRMEVARDSMNLILEQLKQLQDFEGVQLDEDAKPILNFGLCTVVRSINHTNHNKCNKMVLSPGL